jgi:hypothetical protein
MSADLLFVVIWVLGTIGIGAIFAALGGMDW